MVAPRARPGLGPSPLPLPCPSTTRLTFAATPQATLPAMRDRGEGGCLVLVSSAVVFAGMVGYAQYAPSKYAVRGLADCLRNELLGDKIRVVGFYPSNMDTPGFAEEQKTKPIETQEIEGSVTLFKAEEAAGHLMSGGWAGLGDNSAAVWEGVGRAGVWCARPAEGGWDRRQRHGVSIPSLSSQPPASAAPMNVFLCRTGSGALQYHQRAPLRVGTRGMSSPVRLPPDPTGLAASCDTARALTTTALGHVTAGHRRPHPARKHADRDGHCASDGACRRRILCHDGLHRAVACRQAIKEQVGVHAASGPAEGTCQEHATHPSPGLTIRVASAPVGENVPRTRLPAPAQLFPRRRQPHSAPLRWNPMHPCPLHERRLCPSRRTLLASSAVQLAQSPMQWPAACR